jgi:hypothetical protein
VLGLRKLAGQGIQRFRKPRDFPLEDGAELCGRRQVAIAAKDFEAERGLTGAFGSEIRDGALQGMGGILQTVGVSGHNCDANCLKESRGILGEDAREFLEELHVATHTFENSVAVQ